MSCITILVNFLRMNFGKCMTMSQPPGLLPAFINFKWLTQIIDVEVVWCEVLSHHPFCTWGPLLSTAYTSPLFFFIAQGFGNQSETPYETILISDSAWRPQPLSQNKFYYINFSTLYGIPSGLTDTGIMGTGTDSPFCTCICTRIRLIHTHGGGFSYT